MVNWLRKFLVCLGKAHDANAGTRAEDYPENIWSEDLVRHSSGECSMAMVRGNKHVEDRCHVVVTPAGTFFGVYDGHGGSAASQFVLDHLHTNFTRILQEAGGVMSDEVLRNAFSETENEFIELIRKQFSLMPAIAAIGSCVLVGVLWGKDLYLANLGDCRAVMGGLMEGQIWRERAMTVDHNARSSDIRKELQEAHPDVPDVVLKRGVWRVKGNLQVTRSIGDAYLKFPEFSLNTISRYKIKKPIVRPVVRADPEITKTVLHKDDRFIVFATDGLWDELSNTAVDLIVRGEPRPGIARTLIRRALEVAATKNKMTYEQLKRLDEGQRDRRPIHDDMTVIVVFFDQAAPGEEPMVSYTLGNDPGAGPSSSSNAGASSSSNAVQAVRGIYRAEQLVHWKPEAWIGVQCFKSSIINLQLHGLELTGNLGYQLSNLKTLKHMFMQRNQLTGSVFFLSNLSLTDLNIEDNHFSDVIPENFQAIAALRIGGVALVASFLAIALVVQKHRSRGKTLGSLESSENSVRSLPIGTVQELQITTNSLGEENFLCEGSLGSVYRAEFLDAYQLLTRWASSKPHDSTSLGQMVDPAAIIRTISSKSASRFADIISPCIQPKQEFKPTMPEVAESLMQKPIAPDGPEVADSFDRSLRSTNTRFCGSPTLSCYSV
ncbi:PREDICTED: probable protein phosphatase 2C 43 isoform X2 [Erythranthe guttata]|uniref:probable protein phosphatase 2C 43 isoform X2 n=1 Tax=Erythranthe guttata TaxID=4155 RepID=UPI00064DF3D4|nr:PREDICTED: probable protein phosphatase 2C 43 isoform X2 [Erythranthe guttata]|eukprot:XP_012834372.1 PREDICTED: probable protein phosphatase 2C 43 isoform X2 [Erythranthe guttata]